MATDASSMIKHPEVRGLRWRNSKDGRLKRHKDSLDAGAPRGRDEPPELMSWATLRGTPGWRGGTTKQKTNQKMPDDLDATPKIEEALLGSEVQTASKK